MNKQLFCTQIFQKRIVPNSSQLLKEALREILILPTVDEVGVEWSKSNYFNGYTSYSSIDRLHLFSTTFEHLEKKIRPYVYKYLKSMGYIVPAGSLQMSTFWGNVMNKGCHHSFHLHPGCIVSGTLYLQVPDRKSGLVFEDPRIDALMAALPRAPKAKQQFQQHVQLIPQVGDLILFESWLRHQVPAVHSSKSRVSVSFNYQRV